MNISILDYSILYNVAERRDLTALTFRNDGSEPGFSFGHNTGIRRNHATEGLCT